MIDRDLGSGFITCPPTFLPGSRRPMQSGPLLGILHRRAASAPNVLLTLEGLGLKKKFRGEAVLAAYVPRGLKRSAVVSCAPI